MRVTQAAIATNAYANVQGNLGRLTDIQSKLSSGRNIARPSDDPTGSVLALQVRTQLSQINQYQRNASDALSWLTTIDSTLSTAVTNVTSVQTLVVQAKNTGANDVAARSAIADQIDQLRDQLVGLANTTVEGRPVFGGATASPAAFTPQPDGTYAYTGDAGAVNRQVADATTVNVSQTGTDVFGQDDTVAGTSTIFSLYSKISTDLRNPAVSQSNLDADLTALDTASGKLKVGQATEGALYNRVQDAQNVNERSLAGLTEQQSALEDVDAPKLLIDLSLQKMSYDAGLSVTAQILQGSLLDYLH